MKRFVFPVVAAALAVMTVAGPVAARDFGAIYVDDAVYRVFGNAANVPDGTGTDPFATFTNSTNSAQRGVAHADGYAEGAVELGRLKADRGNQNYEVPAGTDLSSVRW